VRPRDDDDRGRRRRDHDHRDGEHPDRKPPLAGRAGRLATSLVAHGTSARDVLSPADGSIPHCLRLAGRLAIAAEIIADFGDQRLVFAEPGTEAA
jgi:hypothetical protein